MKTITLTNICETYLFSHTHTHSLIMSLGYSRSLGKQKEMYSFTHTHHAQQQKIFSPLFTLLIQLCNAYMAFFSSLFSSFRQSLWPTRTITIRSMQYTYVSLSILTVCCFVNDAISTLRGGRERREGEEGGRGGRERREEERERGRVHTPKTTHDSCTITL